MMKSFTNYRVNQKLSVFLMVVAFVVTMIMSIQGVLAQSTYYVGGTGASDSNPGTSSQPWATIQKAASTVSAAGSIINIRTGTYRETITPTYSGTSGNPITYQPDGSAVVTISGLNDAGSTGWTVHSGNIYKKTITLPVASGFNENTLDSNTILMANQVFKDGVMQILARWPKANSVQDLFDKTKMRARGDMVSFGVNSLTDNSIPPDLTGGYVSMNGWYQTQTRQITSQAGTTINYATSVSSMEQFLNFYYVTNKLSLLTQAGEWHYESGILYFWQTGGGSPTGVEYKARNWGFDLRGKSNIKIYGLQFLGCDPVNGDSGSVNTTVERIIANYINHDFSQFDAGDVNSRSAKQSGIKLLGANSVIKDSEIAYAGAHGIWLGPNCRAENNLIHDIAYNGAWGSALKPWSSDDGQVMTHNTIYRTGRGAFELHANTLSNLNMDIGYNDVSMFNMLSIDGGAIYSGWLTDLTGTRIHHNWFHHTGVVRIGTINGVQVTGVYTDQASGPVTVDHNVTWSGDECDYYSETKNEERDSGGNKLYNNTFAGTDRNYINYSTPAVSDVQKNNIYRGDIVCNNPNVTYSLAKTVDPLFVGSGTSGLYYRIQTGSPAKNTGVAISGITDGSIGTPDIGAYEFGGTDWVPGYVPVVGGTVATPTFSPVAGTYTSTQSVTISTSTSGAEVRYTTDGSTPTGSSTLYSSPVSVAVTTTLKAIGIKSGMTDSAVDTAAYTISAGGETKYEAESAQLAGGAAVNTNHTGYSGTGFVDGLGAVDASVTFTVSVSSAGSKNITLRYANADPARTLSIYANSVKISQISMPTTGSWDTWGDLITALSLNAGTNTIKYQYDSGDNGNVNVDYITVPDTGGTVATPTFSPVAGTYTSTQSVTISTTTSEAEIRYTTDGSTPTDSSTLYSTPVSVAATTTLKAIGIKSGMTTSAVGTALYTISTGGTNIAQGKTATQSSTYLTCVASRAVDGSTNGAGEAYISHTNSDAQAWWMVDLGANYNIGDIKVWNRTDSDMGRLSDYYVRVLNSSQVEVWSNHQTTYPNPTTTVNAGGITGRYVKVQLTGTGFLHMAEVQVYESAGGTVATPTFSPAAGTYTSTQSVTISTTTSGAEIRYTTDGSTPTGSSTLYSSPVSVSVTTTLKAIGIKSGLTTSAVGTAAYTISAGGETKYEAESAQLAGGAAVNTNHTGYSGTGFVDGLGAVGASVTFTVSVSSAGSKNITLRYANADPARTLSIYANSVKISQISMPTTGSWDTWGDLITALSLNSGTNTIKYQYDSGDNGNVNVDYITVPDTGGTVATPTFSPVAGTYTSTQSVTISTTTSEAEIRYTTDGSTPTDSSTLYSSPVSVSVTTTLKAIGIKSGLTTSAVGTAAYTIDATSKYEAEVASLAGGAAVNTNHTGYSGTGFVDGLGAVGASVTFTVDVSAAGNRDATLRYANADPARTLSIYANSVKISQISMPTTGSWDTWGDKITTLSLNAGTNTIKYQYDSGDNGAVNIDYIILSDLKSASINTSSNEVTGVEDLQTPNECIVYPNPSNGSFSLKSNNSIKKIEIYNVSGAKIYTRNNINQDRIEDINVSSFPGGIYLVRVFDGESIFSKKLIIRKD